MQQLTFLNTETYVIKNSEIDGLEGSAFFGTDITKLISDYLKKNEVTSKEEPYELFVTQCINTKHLIVTIRFI